jgi:hypothetical protein
MGFTFSHEIIKIITVPASSSRLLKKMRLLMLNSVSGQAPSRSWSLDSESSFSLNATDSALLNYLKNIYLTTSRTTHASKVTMKFSQMTTPLTP